MQDKLLDWSVVVLPTLLSLGGVLFTLEPLDKKYRLKWRVGLVSCGVIVSFLTYRQQERQHVRAQDDANELISRVTTEARNDREKVDELAAKLAKIVAQQPTRREPAAQKSPTAEEIASLVTNQLKNIPQLPNPPVEKNPIVSTKPPVKEPEVPQPPPEKPCRSNRLGDCTSEQLLEWGKPLLARIEAIQNDYLADLKKRDEIKSGWFGEFVGDVIGGGSDTLSKRIKAAELAEQKASDQFRNCCAESALAYHKELILRNGGGGQDTEVYEWVENLLQPEKSKEWKKARQDCRITSVASDLRTLQLKLQLDAIDKQSDAIKERILAK